MKFVHCMVYEEKFTKPITEFYSKFFDNSEHVVCFFAKERNAKNNYGLLKTSYFALNNKKYNLFEIIKNINVLRKYDFIVIHSNFFNEFYKLFFLLNSNLMNKIVWIEWGYDLYTLPEQKNMIRRKIYDLFCSKIKNFIAIFPPDIEVFKNTFKTSKANVFYAPYTGYPNVYKNAYYKQERNLENIVLNKQSIYIQVGHNALPTLNHIDTLNMLKKYANENIKIILPLSYGDSKYADKVEKYAKATFGDKVICLREFLPYDEYLKIIDNVSICIFNTYRQCALGNIHQMILNNVKIFMPSNSIMYKYFNNRGVPIYDLNEITTIDFKQFTKNIEIKDKEAFSNYIHELFDYNKKVELWKNIYSKILEKSNK